ncbi:protein of unknown function [Modestobacter italicus]|uniref:Uncharacterized protein n=1 Tax=Modestobacter italicus (strain DSM 44449 / CECT 9708 / BC 501) TaxID=2732864 RepID=I4EWP7_MODI5|nr:protein of unknown function [Modestobacter marinus]
MGSSLTKSLFILSNQANATATS